MTSVFWNMAAIFAGTFATAFLLTPCVRRLAVGLGRIARPKPDRWHSRPTALLGGVAIFGGIVIVAGASLPWNFHLAGIGLGLLAIFVLGLVDDFVGIPPYVKLVGQLIAAMIPLMFGVRIEMFAHPAVAVLVTIAWFVAVTNAFNLLDNMDGLAAGIAAISASILGVEAAMRGDLVGGSLAMAVGGAALGFLPFNFHPARIFMGDCGSMTLGYALAATAILGPWSGSTSLLLTLSVPFLILAVPLFDAAFVTVVRTINRRPISQGGRDHTSHRLVFLGLSEPRAVIMLYALSGGLGLMALAAARYEVYTAIVLVAGAAIFLFFLGVFLGEVRVYKERDLPPGEEETRNLTRLYTTVYYKKQIVEVVVDIVLVTAAYISAFLLRFDGHLSQGNAALVVQSLPIVLAVSMASFLYFGLYRAVWRYVGLHDLLNVAKAVTTATVVSMLAILLLTRFAGYSRSVFVIFGLLALIFVGGSRALVRLLREYVGQATEGGRRVLIYGAGDAGELIIREIRHHRTSEFKPVGIIDDDAAKVGLRIHGVPVLGEARDLGRLAVELGVEEVIIAIPSADERSLDTIQSTCASMGLKVRRMLATISEEETKSHTL